MNVECSVEVVDEAAGGQLTHFVTGIINCGKIRFYDGGDGIIIKADEGDVFGDLDAHLADRHHTSYGAVIVRDEYGVGQGGHRADEGGCVCACFLAEVACDDIVFAVGDVVIRECFLVSFQPVDIDISFGWGGDMDDTAAAEADQVGGGFIGGLLVVDEDAGAILVFGHAVEKDERGLL